MIIPITQVSHEILTNIIEAFVLQEGTEYGENDIALAEKVAQVLTQLQSGEAFLVYSELHETVNIVAKDQLKADDRVN